MNIAVLNKRYSIIAAKIKTDPENTFNFKELWEILYDFICFSLEINKEGWLVRSFDELIKNKPPKSETFFYNKLAFKAGKYIWGLKSSTDVPMDERRFAIIFQRITELPWDRKGNGWQFLMKSVLRLDDNAAMMPEVLAWVVQEPFDLLSIPFRPNVKDGVEYAPTAQLVASKLTHALLRMDYSKHEEAFSNKAYKALLPLLKKGNEAVEKSEKWFFYAYYLVKLKIWSGEDAFDDLIKIIPEKPKEAYLWDLLGDIAPEQHKRSCYAMALYFGNNEKSLINIHLKYCLLLAAQKEYAFASAELDIVLKTRQKNEWKITSDLIELQQKDWYRKTTKSKNERKAFYLQDSYDALNLVFKPVLAIFQYQKEKEDKPTKEYVMHFLSDALEDWHYKQKNPSKAKKGDFYELFPIWRDDSFSNGSKSAAFIFQSKRSNKKLKKSISGPISIIDQGFGFIGDAFVPAFMVKQNNLSNNQTVHATLVLSWNRNKKQWGWVACEIEKK